MLSVCQSVGRLVGYNQLVGRKEKSVFPVTSRVVIYIKEGRKKEAEGFINIGKC